MFSLLVCLAIPGADLAPTPVSAPSPAAIVTALSERTRLAWEGGIETLLPADRPFELGSSAYLQLDAGAEAMVSWPGAASLRLTGPTRLEWDPALEGGPLVLRLFQTREAYLDVRRHGAGVHFVGWHLSLQVGSAYFERKPDGSWRVHLDAGVDALLASRDVPGEGVLVPAGSQLRVAEGGSLRRLAGPHLSRVRISPEASRSHPRVADGAEPPSPRPADPRTSTVVREPRLRLELPEQSSSGSGMRRTVWSAREFLALAAEPAPVRVAPPSIPGGLTIEDDLSPPAPREVETTAEPQALRLGVFPRFSATNPFLLLPYPAAGASGDAPPWSVPQVWRILGLEDGLELFRYGIRRRRSSGR